MTPYVSRIVQIVLQATIESKHVDYDTEERDLLLLAVTDNTPTDICVDALIEAWLSTMPHPRSVCPVMLC
jgi:hypothetical protein